MKKEQFEFNELPYPTLARFGLTQEMIEDLPLCILKEIGKGGYSPVLPMRVTNENGEVIESRVGLPLSVWIAARWMWSFIPH